MIATIQNAIETREVLEIDYFPGIRVIEPHSLGHSADGKVLLRAYQTSGASESGEHANWKLFRMDRAGYVSPTGETFSGPRSGYKRGDKAMKGGVTAQL